MARPRLPPSLLLPLLLLQASDTFAGIVDSGALLVAPKVWRAGSEERVCVTVFNVPSQTRTLIESEPSADRSISANFEPVTGDTRRRLSNILSLLRSGDRIAERRPARTTVSSAPAPIREHRSSRISRRTVEVFVGFANSKNGRSVFEDSKHVPAGSGATTSCFGVSVPETLKASYIYVKVQGKTAVWSKVRVEPKVLVTLVQTDKAKYRPGQTVKLRVLSLRQDFTALDDTIKEIWITAPEGTRLAQWLDVRMDVGLVQKEFQLTQEPPLGRWTIHVRRGDGATTKQSFDVEEFVPPRFELDVNVPGVLYRDSRVLTVKVCAKYTFGKPLVAADVRLVITNSSGRVIYVVPAQYDEIAYITFKGRTLGTEQRFSLPLVRAWYSPSESFLLIDARSLLGGVKCGQTVTVDVRRSANFRADAMRYLVLARGDIVGDGPVHSNSVRIVINSRMAPSFRLLVYAVTDQGEVVADSKVVRVAPCLPNKVSVSWSAAQVRPGDTASLTVTGSPGSLCGVDAVDRSAQLLGTSNTVSVGKVFSQLSVILRLEDVPGVQLQGQRERALCVGTDQPSVSTFPVLFTELGQRSLVVSVRATGAACGRPNDIGVQSDALVRDILVKPEGFPQEEALTERVCAKEGGSNTHVFELGFSPRVVPGSSRAVVSIYGDPLGQAITQLTGLESLVKVPHGCGEQNMVYLVPNILVHQYMKAKDMLSAELKKKTVDNMLSGYQRQLRYRHSDGSYSAFGESRWRRTQGSLWLTVYVMRWFAVARKLVPIDAEDLAASRRWVEQHQRSDGCFNRVGWLYDKAMSGGVADGGRLALTAFTVLALLEADSGSAALRRAVRCLRDGTPSGLYAQVLVAHALLEAGERAAAEAAVPGLLRRAVRGEDSLHWRSGRSSRWSGSSALDVEITAYMTLTLLRLGGHETDVAAAVRWLDRRRNGHGGWVSTQDTVVALSALVAVERRSSELKAHKVDVTVTSGNTFRRQFQVTASNRLLHQQAELRPLQLPTTVSVTAAGSGCIMAQTVLRYSLKETKAKQAFQIKHDIRPAQTGLCQTFILQICASYTTADAASNMAIIEIEMLSGFVAIDYVLQELVRSNVIRRWEVRQAVLALYFDQLVKKTLCFDVHVLQEAVVQRLKPATIAVYDYYTTEHRLETEYRLPACG
ncbi:Murinoglobulin-2 [Amphibalanus amphitrite]|uniref:TEP1-F n=1 Tax=Amphibalanus amphitrite TaxID=1232801 RepID=A0A6A4VBF0_AMPAM|nr:Murinoglobulin-2 [Amphibalanus amphitrite]